MAKKTDTQVKQSAGPIESHGVTVTDDDFVVVGGLRYICLPENNEGRPITGWTVALLDMPEKFKWKQAILLNLTSSARVVQDDETIDAQPGDDVLIPVSGNLKNNAELLKACVDPRIVTMARFTYLGEKDIGKPSPMKEFEVALALKKQIARTGQFALYNQPQAGAFIPGEVLNGDGKPAARLVG